MLEHACDLEMAQHWIHWVSLKIRLETVITCQNPELAHFFSSKILRWLKIRIIFASNPISLRILSHLRIFELKKWANSGFWHMINISSRNFRETQLIEFWAISGSHACSNMWQISFDDFLSYLRVRPVSGLLRSNFHPILANVIELNW